MDVLKGLKIPDSSEDIGDFIDQMEGQEFVLLETLRNLKKDYDDGLYIDNDYRHKTQHIYNLKKLQIKKIKKMYHKARRLEKSKIKEANIRENNTKKECEIKKKVLESANPSIEKEEQRKTHLIKVETEAKWVKRVLRSRVARTEYLSIVREASDKAEEEFFAKGLKIKGRTI